ncbi:GntR family transcriptional regulator [Inhella gelatinilytica]|uniref:GntR family transcriptional regulator n=1 Tax=Inhella gelatinilytica TaxID=2795030 RepID=A0A931NF25_9BURK|nr:GntR family transcriptional regulator [Inhella gelatinilytica]MBH9553101.1 GntR family transcriptional regulator [Inhella gelatinilytica]
MHEPPPPLAHRALYEEVADHVRQRILARQLEPGGWIDELALCRELGISRTPMREALKVLAAEGLVTMRVRRGAYVTEMSERDVREAYQLLALLEADAAAQLAKRLTDVDKQELATLHRDLESAAGNRDAFFLANERFHLRLLEMEGNRLRQQMVQDLRRLMKLNRHHSLFHQGRLDESLQEHRDILSALIANDAPLAAERMRAHFLSSLRTLHPSY